MASNASKLPTKCTHKQITNNEFCRCCKTVYFTRTEREMYEVCKRKGRRGNVMSLSIDQSISYVCLLDEPNEIFLKFRFVNGAKRR